MATISDVAQLAGVSMMTVSRVINKSGPVSDATRQKVLSAVERLGYRPNMLAKGLATKRSQLIAYVMSNMANPFFGNVSMGIEHTCMERGYSMIIFDASGPARMEECVEMLVDRQIDGVIFHHLFVTPAQAAVLQKNGVTCVTIDNEAPLERVTSVDSDDYLGARMATRHLLEKGHRRIGCIRGKIGPRKEMGASDEFIESFQREIWRQRTAGFLDELKEAGLEPAFLAEGSGTVKKAFPSGGHLIAKVLSLPDPPTAFYCQNDLMALGALGECLERGISVPRQVALIGHDGLEFSMFLYPRVTTVCQPQYQMGRLAAGHLLDEIQGISGPESIITQSSLYIGDTT